MRIKLIPVTVLSVITLLSCGENKEEQANSTQDLNKVFPSTVNQQPETTTSISPSQSLGTINMQPVTTTGNSALNEKLNPAHGEPGHRCDIAVGSPLNGSAPINTTTPTTTQPMTINPSQTNPTQPVSISTSQNTPTQTADKNLKVNPAHGQPGHRCDISVGAPLDGSSAVKTNVNQTGAKNPLQYFPPVPKVTEDVKKSKTDSTGN